MADTKITALAAITTVDPAADVLPIVDVSDTSMAASGTTKKITSNQILGAGGTATLASATITGDLTVDTSTLKVDSANNRVGIGTATPSVALDVVGASALSGTVSVGTTTPLATGSGRGNVTINGSTDAILAFGIGGVNSGFVLQDSAGMTLLSSGATYLRCYTNNSERYRIASDGVATWSNVGGVAGTAMTLNSTGLGVGASPSHRLTVSGTAATNTTGLGLIGTTTGYNRVLINNTSGGGQFGVEGSTGGSICNSSTAYSTIVGSYQNYPLHFITNNNVQATIDASGNLLVGKSTAGALGTVGHEIKANGEVFATQSASTNVATTYHAYSSGAAAYRFYVGMGGTVYATNTTISAISDARLKENVQDIDVGLGAILALKPRKFDWKEGKGKNIKGDRGFIAQEFETVFPNLIDEWKDAAPEGETPYKSVRQDLIPVLVKAIQELTARVQTLEAK